MAERDMTGLGELEALLGDPSVNMMDPMAGPMAAPPVDMGMADPMAGMGLDLPMDMSLDLGAPPAAVADPSSNIISNADALFMQMDSNPRGGATKITLERKVNDAAPGTQAEQATQNLMQDPAMQSIASQAPMGMPMEESFQPAGLPMDSLVMPPDQQGTDLGFPADLPPAGMGGAGDLGGELPPDIMGALTAT